jgi:hypothetical protein
LTRTFAQVSSVSPAIPRPTRWRSERPRSDEPECVDARLDALDERKPHAKAVGVTGDMRAYRLRGSYASLLLYEGRPLTYVAVKKPAAWAPWLGRFRGRVRRFEALTLWPAQFGSERPLQRR